MADPRKRTLLQICQGAAYDAKIHKPDTIIGNTDSDAQLLLKSASRTVEDLVTRNNGHWIALVSEHEFATYTVSFTGTTTVGSPVITGIADSSLVKADIFALLGGPFPNNTVVRSIDSPTQITVNYPATASGVQTLLWTQAGIRLPDDFESFVDGTMWDRTRFWAMRGPLTPQQWQLYKSSVIGKATLQRRWRVMRSMSNQVDYFFIDPPPGQAGANLVFEYNSNAPILAADGLTSQIDWLHDTDFCKLDGRVVELGVKYRVLDRLGQDFSTAFDEYERRADALIARDGGMGILDVAPLRELSLIGPWNVPDTGFGP